MLSKGWWIGLVLGSCLLTAWAQDRDTKVRNDKKLLEASEHWIYNDLSRGFREARRRNKPLLVVVRCIPCEACHEFDERVVERDAQVRELLDQFVCVRLPMANHLDLGLFQFDYDMSFAVMYLHPEGTILGRFGTRTGRDNEHEDMHLEGFADSMRRVLALYRDYPRHRQALQGKHGPPPLYPYPEEFPSLKGKYSESINYESNPARSCLHCHQIREAQRLVYRQRGEAVPEALMFPWPSPSVLGIKIDPHTATTILRVEEGSPAAHAGLQPGDVLWTMQGQPLVSVADIQWVLEQTGEEASLAVEARRGDRTIKSSLELSPGWRRRAGIEWRVTSWDLRRMVLGGMKLQPLGEEARERLRLPSQQVMALRIEHVGEYGDHARAKQAGLRRDDVLLAYDGRRDFRSEAELLAYGMQQKRAGDEVMIEVLREGRRLQFRLILQ